MDEQIKFSGLVYCADCGATMVLYRAKTIKESDCHFACRTYKAKGKDVCSAHFIKENQLKLVILNDLRETLKFARDKNEEFGTLSSKYNEEQATLKTEIPTIQARIIELKTL